MQSLKQDRRITRKLFSIFLTLLFMLPVSSIIGDAAAPTDLTVVGTATPNPAEVGETVFFNAMISLPLDAPPGELVYSWRCSEFGSISGNPATYVFSHTGTFTVTVTATLAPYQTDVSGGGGGDPISPEPILTATDTFTVWVSYKPQASFTTSTTEPRAYLDSVHFDASGSYDPDGYISSYKWDFGDGDTAAGAIADHVFKEGTYTVKLTVTDNGGFSDTATVTINSNLPKYRITNTIDNSTDPKVYYYQNELRVFWIENGSSVMESTSNDDGWTWSNASEIFSSPSLSITNIQMAYDENNLVLAVECAPPGEFPFLYILYSNDAGNTWFSPYALRGDRPSIDIVGSDIYLVYRRWSGLGTPDFYLTMVITCNVNGTVYSHPLANPSGSREFTGVPKISVIRSESVTHIYVTVADYVTKNVYFWESLNSGTAWSNPEVIAELTEVDGDYMDLKASPHALYFIWSDKRMGNYELWFKVYREGGWSEDLLLTNALGDSFDPVMQIDRDSFVHILWSDFRDCNYEIYETVLDYNGNTLKNDSRITTTSGNSSRPDMFIDSQDKTLLTSEYYTFDVWQDNSEGNCEIYFKNNIVDGYIGQTTASLTSTVQTAQDYISALPNDYFSTPNLRKPLINKYDVVGRLLENGNYLAATNKIKYDITPKMDGFEGGNPRNDWIIADTAQDYLGGVNKILVLQPGGPPGEPIPPPSPAPPPSPSPPATPAPSQPQPEINAVLVVPAETSISISWDVEWPNIIDDPTFVSSATLNGETISSYYEGSSYYAEFEGLTAGTTYTFTIYAAETSGGITYSSTYTSSAETDAHVLQITYGPLVTATTNGGFSSALIEWGTNNPASSILEYRHGTSEWTSITSDTGSDMTTSHHLTISSLSPETTYDYKVSSENPAYSEVPQDTGSFSTPKSINDLAVSPTYDQAVFSWHTDISMNTEVYYKLPWKTEWTSVTIWESVTEHTITITGLQPSTTYDYYVKSKNDPSSAIDLIVISSPSTFTTDAFFSRVEASDYYSIDENGNVIEGTMVSWTTTKPTINNLVKYTTDASTAESAWNVRPTDTGDSVRSHYVLIPFSASADYTYRVYSTVPPSETIAGPTLSFTALPDTDKDGLHDAEEDYGWMVHVDLNGDGDTKDSYENYHTASDRSKPDSDGDGLDDAQEKALGTNPLYYDTDFDGLTDKYEVDTDWDQNTAGVQGTNPLEVDTDGDTLSDGYEVNTDWDSATAGVQGTSPVLQDTDGDGLLDGEEVTTPYTLEYKGGTSWVAYPLGSALFIENDRAKFQISSINENFEKETVNLIQLGFIREDFYAGYHWYLTDGGSTIYASLEDISLCSPVFVGAEAITMSFGFINQYLTFDIEIKAGTNPLNPDTDGDGMFDGDETDFDTNPLLNVPNTVGVSYRVITVYSDRTETKLVRLQEEEVDRWEKVADAKGDTLYGPIDLSTVQAAGDIIYPTIGNPKIIDRTAPETDRTFSIYIKTTQTAYIGSVVQLQSIDGSGTVSLSKISDTWDDANSARKISVCVPPSVPSELYNLKVEKGSVGNWITSLHAVQVVDGFNLPFKFVQITDIHIGKAFEASMEVSVGGLSIYSKTYKSPDTSYHAARFLAILDRINEIEKPDFVVMTGDNVDYNYEKSMKAFKGCLEYAKVPVFVTLGNHERYGLTELDFTASVLGAPTAELKINMPYPAEPTSFYEWVNPKFQSGGEDPNRLADFYFDYGGFRFIVADSGPSKIQYFDFSISYDGVTYTFVQIPDPLGTINKNQLHGFTDTQWNWIQNKAQSQSHVFFFTHGRIVGGGSEQIGRLAYHCADFVNWADGANIEAVFVGHTHQNHMFYDVDTGNINKPPEKSYPESLWTLAFSDSVFYIETECSTFKR